MRPLLGILTPKVEHTHGAALLWWPGAQQCCGWWPWVLQLWAKPWGQALLGVAGAAALPCSPCLRKRFQRELKKDWHGTQY